MVEVVVDSADKETTFKSVPIEHAEAKNRTTNAATNRFFIMFYILDLNLSFSLRSSVIGVGFIVI
jgi:hypothetical protein